MLIMWLQPWEEVKRMWQIMVKAQKKGCTSSCEPFDWLIPVIQAQVAELQDALAALESRVKAAEAEKSKLKKENKDLRKADADKEKEMAELVRDLWVVFAQGAFVSWT